MNEEILIPDLISEPMRSVSRRKPIHIMLAATAVIMLLLMFIFTGQSKTSPLKFRLYTHNIRNDNKNPDPGEEFWSQRKKGVIASIKLNGAYNTVVSLQEVLHNQLEDILEGLNEDGDSWTYYGIGRTDGKTKGEYAPILYKESEWSLLDSNTFWLSKTPDVPSRGWDAALERIVSWTLLKNIQTGSIVNVFNTHLDHRGVVARRESVKLILRKTQDLNDYPSFFCGDFNTQPKDEPYKIVAATLQDTSLVVGDFESYGHVGTFTGWGTTHPATIIDYIWASKTESVTVIGHGVLETLFRGYYMSDHRPVITDVLVN